MTPALPDLSAVLEWPHWNRKSHLARRLLAAQVVWSLKLDGPLEGPDTMTMLADRLTARGVDLSGVSKIALSNLAAELAHQTSASNNPPADIALLSRRVQGRRTFHLSALGQSLPPSPYGDKPVTVEPDEPQPPEPEPAPEPAPEPLPEPSSNGYREMSGAGTVRTLEDKAMLVLRLAGEVALDIAALPPAGSLDDRGRLAEAIAESERLRRRVEQEASRRREAEEQLASQKRVNGALRAQADILQNNLDAHMRYERRPNDSGRRALDQMMREPAAVHR